MKLKLLLLFAMLMPLAMAGEEFEDDELVRLVHVQDNSDLYLILHENGPRRANNPNVPRFSIRSKGGKFYAGVGMNIKAVALFDEGHPMDNTNDFVTYNIPMSINPGDGAKFNYSAQQSNIYLNVVALPGERNQLGAYVSVEFTGDGYAPALDVAYLKWRGLTAGYNFTAFADVSCIPQMIDGEGPNAFCGTIMGTATWAQRFGKNKEWEGAIGIVAPQASYTLGENTAKVNQRVPDIPLYVERSWSGGEGHVRMSGVLRNLTYRDLLAGRNRNVFGWGIKASGVVPIVGGLSASFMGTYGRGMGSYIQDLNGNGFDLAPDGRDGRLGAVKVWGAYGVLTYKFSEKFSGNLAYSHVRTYGGGCCEVEDDCVRYKYAQYGLANLFYQPNRIVQLGLEYLYGRRVDFSGLSAHDNRIQACVQVSF